VKLSKIKNLGKGTYILILFLETDQTIMVGKLGSFEFPQGFYAYVGCAFGSGGLNARLNHHLQQAKKPHWHIDYFREKAVVTGITVDQSLVKLEHEWATGLEMMASTSTPAPRFGATDCKCTSHLFYFDEAPVLEDFGELIYEK
jgi:Uri superfamily endonuclease